MSAIHTTSPLQGFVTGQDLSRAEKANEINRDLKVAEKRKIWQAIDRKRTSGPKGRVDSIAFTPGMNPRPTSKPGFSAAFTLGMKHRLISRPGFYAAFTLGMNRQPISKPGFSVASLAAEGNDRRYFDRFWQFPCNRLQPLLFSLSVAALLIFSQSALAQVSLSSVVDLAERNSSTVKLAAADLQKANAVLQESKNVYVPNFIIGSSIGPPSIGFSFSQPSIASGSMQSLFFSIAQRRYIDAASVGIQAASLSLKDAKEQVALDASSEYIELDTVDRELAAGRVQSELATALVSIEEQRQQAGVDSLADLLQARLTAAQLKLSQMHLESRAATLAGELAALTGLPAASIQTVSSSIPEIPEVQGREATKIAGVEAADAAARSRQLQANGDDQATKMRPLIAFGAQYNRDATSLNNYNTYFSAKRKFKADNFSAGFNIQIPIFDLVKRAKARESAAEALRATVEAEQAERQNEIQIATLSGSLRELDALAEVASLKLQIAEEQVKAVRVELQNGNGAGIEPGAPPQLSPKAEKLALIDERQKAVEALDSGFDLTKARLNLLRALGHIDDWLHEFEPEVQTANRPITSATGTPEGTVTEPE